MIYPKSDGWGMQAVPKVARRVREPQGPAGGVGGPQRRGPGRGHRRPGRDLRPHQALLRLRGLARGHPRARRPGPRGLTRTPRCRVSCGSPGRFAPTARPRRPRPPTRRSPPGARARAPTMPSSTPRADSIPPAALVRCSLIRRTSSIAPSARSTSARSAGASSPSTPPARHQHPRPGQRVGDLQRQRDPSSGSIDHEQLVAADLAQRRRPRGQPVLGRHDPDAVVGAALGHRLLELGQRLLARLARVLGLEDDPPARGARAAVDVHHDVALAPAGAAEVADRVAVVAHPARDRVHRLGHRLLVGAALGGAARGLGRDVRRPSRARSAGPPARASSATICSRIASSCASWRVAASRAARRCAALKSASGLEPSARGELPQQVLAHARGLLEHDLRAAGAARRRVEPSPNSRASSLARCPFSGAEDLVDLGPEELGHHPRLVGERGLHLARDLLELVADELGVDRVLLALQHPRADLDRVRRPPAPGSRPPRSGGPGTPPWRDRRRRRSRRSPGPSGRARGVGGGAWRLPRVTTHATRRSGRNPQQRFGSATTVTVAAFDGAERLPARVDGDHRPGARSRRGRRRTPLPVTPTSVNSTPLR